MQVLTIAVSVLCVVAVICGFLLWALAIVCNYRERLLAVKIDGDQSRMRLEVAYLARWCSWYFPIIEDIETYLLSGNEDVSTFRDRMWKKYGKREPDGAVPNAASTGEKELA